MLDQCKALYPSANKLRIQRLNGQIFLIEQTNNSSGKCIASGGSETELLNSLKAYLSIKEASWQVGNSKTLYEQFKAVFG